MTCASGPMQRLRITLPQPLPGRHPPPTPFSPGTGSLRVHATSGYRRRPHSAVWRVGRSSRAATTGPMANGAGCLRTMATTETHSRYGAATCLGSKHCELLGDRLSVTPSRGVQAPSGLTALRPFRSLQFASPSLECGHPLKCGDSCSDVWCGWRANAQGFDSRLYGSDFPHWLTGNKAITVAGIRHFTIPQIIVAAVPPPSQDQLESRTPGASSVGLWLLDPLAFQWAWTQTLVDDER